MKIKNAISIVFRRILNVFGPRKVAYIYTQ